MRIYPERAPDRASRRAPRIAAALLRLVARPADREFVLADLAEEYGRIAAARGDGAARVWYWRQTAESLVPLLADRLRTARAGDRTRRWPVDVVEAWRWLWRNPALTSTMAGTLTVALTAALAAFLLLYSVVLRPLPFPEPERIVSVVPVGPRLPTTVRAISFPDLQDWQQLARGYSALSGSSLLTLTMTEPGEPRRVDGLRVGLHYDEVLGVAPVAGRPFDARDYEQGSQYVALLTHAFWQRAFGASPAAVGGTLVLDDRKFLIVGVLPPLAFGDIAEPHDFWVPLLPRPGVGWEPVRGNGYIDVIARLAPGVTVAAGEAELSSIARRMAEAYPSSNGEKVAVAVRPLHDVIAGPVKPALLLILLAVVSVVFVACGNLTNLSLAHAERRRLEFSVRLALGAEPLRLRCQIAAEMFTIASLAGIVALVAAPGLARTFLSIYPATIPGAGTLTLAPAVVAAAAGLVLAVTIALMLPQMRRLPQSAPAAGRRATGDRWDRRGRALLVGAQVAFTIVLAFCGVALGRSMARLSALDPGFAAQGVVAFSVSPSPARFEAAAQTRAFFEQLLAEIRALPGVHSAAAATAIPFVNRGWAFSIPSPDRQPERVLVGVTIASPGFFETLRIPLKRGRLLTDDEHRGDQRLVVINESLARLTPYPDPIGRTIPYSGTNWEVAGIVADSRQMTLLTPPRPEIFLPWNQAGRAPQRIIVRADGDPLAIVPAVTARVRQLDALTPIADVVTLEARVARSTAADRFRAALVASLAAIAVTLAALGVWSVTAFVVARQERENGIRLALGESSSQMLARILGRTARPAIAGAVAGMLLSLWVARSLEAFLFELRGRDPVTLAVAVSGVLACTLAAALVPARRALRTDPAAALRAE